MWEVCRRWEEFQGELPSEEDEELHFTVELKQIVSSGSLTDYQQTLAITSAASQSWDRPESRI